MASEALILQLLQNPPDRNEPLPVSNRKETIYGSTVPFLVMSLIAVGIRLWIRFRIQRDPGLDDLFVVLAATCNTIGTICVLLSIEYGLGHHYLYLPLSHIATYTKLFYIENAMYITQTALIKISLLLQYLRIFKAGIMHRICVSLIAIIAVWGCGYSFMAWVPCFPVRGYWDRSINPKCYGFGFEDPATFIALFESHTATNMAFDIAVFCTPMVLFSAPNLKKKNVLTMTGIFLVGAVVVFTSVWRLYTIVENRAATHPYIDFTWWTPISIILSCLEIDLAIMCASMPIFWPVIEKSFSQIFVTHEVHITEHNRVEDDGVTFELEQTERGDVKRKGSVKSDSGNSRESLTRETTREVWADHYRDPYMLAQVDPLGVEHVPGVGVETNVDSQPAPKWRI